MENGTKAAQRSLKYRVLAERARKKENMDKSPEIRISGSGGNFPGTVFFYENADTYRNLNVTIHWPVFAGQWALFPFIR